VVNSACSRRSSALIALSSFGFGEADDIKTFSI
jgi:hypothetical protein